MTLSINRRWTSEQWPMIFNRLSQKRHVGQNKSLVNAIGSYEYF